MSAESEKERYALHQNGLDNAPYRLYLEQILDSVFSYISRECSENTRLLRVLDWGSGPEPSLVGLLREKGYDARGYDPFFLPEFEPFSEKADLVTCVEVAEHFHRPAESFAAMVSNLRNGGFMAIKTGFLPENSEIDTFFSTWWYREDLTHVCFYSVRALEEVSTRVGLTLCGFAAKDIAILRKN